MANELSPSRIGRAGAAHRGAAVSRRARRRPCCSVLSEFAEVALHFVDLGSEQFEAEEPLLGRVGSRHLASGYATAVLEDVRACRGARGDRRTSSSVSPARSIRTDVLRSALADSSRPIGDRRKLISDLLEGRASPVTIRLAGASLHGRIPRPGRARSTGWQNASPRPAGGGSPRVSTARDLDDERTRRARAGALQDLTGEPGRAACDRGRRAARRCGDHRREPAGGRKRAAQARPVRAASTTGACSARTMSQWGRTREMGAD